MFYKAELLSLQSNTEISLVYYVSTSNSRKKIPKKDLIDFDIISATENMIFPEIPFSLRLYSYLINGLAKIWAFKFEEYLKKLKKTGVDKKRATKRISNIRKAICPNLEIENVYFEHISETESHNSLNINNQINNIVENNPVYDFGIEEFINERSTISELEALRKSSSLLSNERVIKKSKNVKYDFEIALRMNKILSIKKANNGIKFNDLINCTLIEEYKKLIEDEKRRSSNDEIEIIPEIEWSVQNSLEDVRNSNSSLLSFNKNPVFETRLDERNNEKVEWFYSILEKASRGEVIPYQNEPYGEIILM